MSEPPYDQFQAVFEEHYNTLCNYALTYLHELSSSEDVVQEVFARVWEKRQDLVGSDAIRFYLFTAVRNNCLSYLDKGRKSATVEIKEEDATEENLLFSNELEPETDFRSYLLSALDLLPPKCREVFMLSRMSRLSYKEIAETLDISVKTVENQIGKALKIIRVFLADKNIFVGMGIFIMDLIR